MARLPQRSAKPPATEPNNRKEVIAKLLADHSDALLATILGGR